MELATQQRSLWERERGAERLLARITRWAAATKSGDLSELSDLPDNSFVLPAITSTRENCLGQECAQFSRCHVVDARRKAQAADIVIVNHHLLLADLALKDEGFGDLLPGAEAVILDEAHQIPDTAAQFFGRNWSARQVQVLLNDAAAELAAAGARAPDLAADISVLQARLDDVRACFPRGVARYEWASLPDSFLDALPEIEAALTSIATQLEGLGAGAGTANCARRALALAQDLAALREVPADSGLRWVDTAAAGLSLQFTPFEIAARLREYVESRPCAWVFTSATLAIGADFSHFATRVGLPDARSLCIGSPFDYPAQARIYLPPRMPDPQSPAFAARFIEVCAPLLEACGGRAFLLYTSYRALGGRCPCPEGAFSQAAVSGAGAGRSPEGGVAQPISRIGKCGAIGHGQLLGGRRRERRRIVHRGHRQVAVCLAGRSLAEGAAGRHSASRRQPVFRISTAASGAGLEAGRRTADPRLR